MRVCHVAPELLPVPPTRGGAIETWIHAVACELARRGVDVHVVTVGHPGARPSTEPFGAGQVTYHPVPMPPFLSWFPLSVTVRGYHYFRRAGRLIERLQPDIVHHHNRPLGLLIAETTYRVPCRHVMSLQNIDYGWCLTSKRVDRLFFERGFARCDRILAASDFIRRYTVERLRTVDPQRLETLHNGVDTAVFQPNEVHSHRAEFGLTQDPLILFTGRIDPRKGVLEVLEVFRRVRKELPAAQLAVVGPRGSYWDPQATAYARQVEAVAQGLPGVRVLGPIYDRARLAQLYGTADVACLPFASPEGFGLTSIEVQACGVPVVTTTMGGVPETVRDGETGFLVAPGNLDAITQRTLQVLQDRALRVELGRAAAAFAAREFSWRIITDRLLRHYEALMPVTGR